MSFTPIQKPPLYSLGYFGYWADMFMPRLANRILPWVVSHRWMTANVVSGASFVAFCLGILSALIQFPYHLWIAAFGIIFSYFLDCLDGQVARSTKTGTAFGSYVDKILDIYKIFSSTAVLVFMAYQQTQEVSVIVLGLVASFGMMSRFYIKYCVMIGGLDADKQYFEKSRVVMIKEYNRIGSLYDQLQKTPIGFLKYLWLRHSVFFFFDEGEYIFLTAAAIALNRPQEVLWILAVSQVVLTLFRTVQRGIQLKDHSPELLKPLRK